MLLNRTTLSLAKLASSEASRYTLQGIAVERDRATVTNGHYLVTVTHGSEGKPQFKDDSYPVTPGLEHKTFDTVGPMTEEVLVGRDGALAALKALPRKSSIPVLQSAAMSTDGKLYVNDLENVTAVAAKMEGRFPNWRAVVPQDDDVAAEIVLDANYIVQLASYIASAMNSAGRAASVRLTIYKREYSPIRFDARNLDGQEITALLMPLRDGKDFPKRPDEVKREAAAKAAQIADAEADVAEQATEEAAKSEA